MSESVSGTVWSITINNPSEEDRRLLKECPGWVKETVYQDEVGTEGTLHIQGMIKAKYTIKFNAIKQWLPRAHIEKARNAQALMNYVKKTETAVEGTQVHNEMGDSLSKEFITPSKFPRLVAKVFVEEMKNIEWHFGDKNFLDWDFADFGKVKDVVIEQTIRYMIRKGWHIELLAVNPSVRKALNCYWEDILIDVQGRDWQQSFIDIVGTKLKADCKVVFT